MFLNKMGCSCVKDKRRRGEDYEEEHISLYEVFD